MAASDDASGPASLRSGDLKNFGRAPHRRWRGAAKVLLGIAVVLGIAAALLSIPMSAAREAARRTSCICHLKQIGLALATYRQSHGRFPPAYFARKQGQPVHSWRVMILPQMGATDLYKQYDFDEPWDGPNNSKLIGQMPECYHCPSDFKAPPGTTNYVAIVGEPTMWPNGRGCRMSEITDGASTTIAVVEVTGLNIPWTKPEDLDFATMTMQVNAPTGNCPSSQHPAGVLALSADGSSPLLRNDTPAASLRAYFTKAAGDVIAREW